MDAHAFYDLLRASKVLIEVERQKETILKWVGKMLQMKRQLNMIVAN